MLGLLAVVNLPLGTAPPVSRWGFDVAAVLHQGEVWRLITFPFAHLSLYHLLLDASAFAGLYLMLDAASPWRRLVLAGGAQAGALLGAWGLDPRLPQLGLCGLSGPAHGLMALVALDLARAPGAARGQRLCGWGLVAGLVAKVLWELATGGVALAGLHFGEIGTPLVACHAGGVLGAIAVRALVVTATRSPVQVATSPGVGSDAPRRTTRDLCRASEVGIRRQYPGGGTPRSVALQPRTPRRATGTAGGLPIVWGPSHEFPPFAGSTKRGGQPASR